MNPYLALALAALELTEKLMPQIQAAIQKGEITPEQQAVLKARADAMRLYAFDGPEWTPSNRS